MKNKEFIAAAKSLSSNRHTKQNTTLNEKFLGQWKITLLNQANFSASNILTANQVHGGNIVSADILKQNKIDADGITLEQKDNTKVGVYTADCAPVVITTDRLATALHISRKSIINGLMENVLTTIKPSEINWVYIGLHICEYHFNFDQENTDIRRFRNKFPQATHFHKGNLYFSLTKAIQHYLTDWQVHKDKIIRDGRCTYEMLDLPSYRQWKQAGKPGNKLPTMLTVLESH